MRPPAHSDYLGDARKAVVRPPYATARTCVPAPERIGLTAPNYNSPLVRNVQRGHEKMALPLLSVNRFRDKAVVGDFSNNPPVPHLPRRPQGRAPIVVSTYS